MPFVCIPDSSFYNHGNASPLGLFHKMSARRFAYSMDDLVGRFAAISSDGGGATFVDGWRLRGRGGSVSIGGDSSRAYKTMEGASVAHVWTRQVGINYRSNDTKLAESFHLRDCTEGYLCPMPLLERAHGKGRTNLK